MELGWLEDLIALSVEGNFSRAAHYRNISQPAFSRRIQALEQWVGTKLVERHKRQAVLTPAGVTFKNQAIEITYNLKRAKRDALEHSSHFNKTLTIAATHILSFTFVPKWFSRLANFENQEILNLVSDSMEACEDAMLKGDVSFLLCHTHPAAESKLNKRQYKHKILAQDLLLPLCIPNKNGSPKWKLQDKKNNQTIPYLAYSPLSGLSRILGADWKQRNQSFKLEPIVSSRLALTLLELTKEGRGVAWLPKSIAAPAISSGELVYAGPKKFNTQLDISLIRPVTTLTQIAEVFWNNS